MDPEPQSQGNTIATVEQSIDRLADHLDQAKLSYGHGAIDAQSEALWIISKQLQISPSDALDQLQALLDQPLYDAALAIANERIQTRKPLAYILEEAWLMGVPFYCNEQSIIPRSWIAELITEGALEAWLPADGRALDLCTGNGSLAVLLALSCPDIHVSACDISAPALAVAARNLDRHGLSNQIELFHRYITI